MLRPLSPEEQSANWKAVRAALRRYFLALILPGLALIWAAGYGQGAIENKAACTCRKQESK